MNLNNLSKIKKDIGGLKYIVKRLKKYIAVENSAPFNVDERINKLSEALKCIENKTSQFKSFQLIQTEQIGEINQKMNDLQNEISKCNNSVKVPIIINVFPHQKECYSNEEISRMNNIRDEISRMNENPIFKSEKLNDDYLHSLKDKMDELEKTLQFIEKNFTINSDIKHLKNEVKKLKENKLVNNIADSDSLEQTANDIEEAIKCIKHEVKKLSEQPASVPEQVDFSPIVNDILCLKFEVKCLKEGYISENFDPSSSEKLINNLIEDKLRENEETIHILATHIKNLESESAASQINEIDLLKKNVDIMEQTINSIKEEVNQNDDQSLNEKRLFTKSESFDSDSSHDSKYEIKECNDKIIIVNAYWNNSASSNNNELINKELEKNISELIERKKFLK